MLQYLVTSKVRRRLLSLLWNEKQQGSTSELAERAGVAFAGAHTELKAMLRADLVVSRQERGKEVYSANLDHPGAEALKTLVSLSSRTVSAKRSGDDILRRQLVALGAPLRTRSLAVLPDQRMETLVRGVQLARRDPTVARSLPLCFWMQREALDVRLISALAQRAEDKHALGFFLELTGELGGDRRLGGLAEGLRDRRMTSMRDFFLSGRTDTVSEFPLATRWGFRMTMGLDSFQSLFAEHTT